MFSLLHLKAVDLSETYKRAEAELVRVLGEIDSSKGFTELGYPSLFAYVTRELGFSESSAQALIVVGRKAQKVPELQRNLDDGLITLSKAKTVASVLTPANQEEWLGKAQDLTSRELERAVAEERPDLARREVARPQAEGFTRLSVSLDEEAFTLLERAREILAQKEQKPISHAEALKAIAQDYVKRHDPVEKAERNARNTFHGEGFVQAKHQVFKRDQGACQHRLPDGEICGTKHWVHVHHIKPRAEGGEDAPENLITLCSAHHRMVHGSGVFSH